MLQNIFKRSMVAVAALLMMVASCTKDEKEPELTPKQKAEAVVKDIKKGANTNVKTTKSETDLDLQKKGTDGAVQIEKVFSSVSLNTYVEDVTPLVELYFTYTDENSTNYGRINEREYFAKFVPEVKVSGDIVKVTSKDLKEVIFYRSSEEFEGKREGAKFTTSLGEERFYDNVSFEYNKKTNTINNISITYRDKAVDFEFNTKIELTNLPLDSSKEVVAYGKSQYENKRKDRPSLTARANTSTVLNGVKPIRIKMVGYGPIAEKAVNNFKPDGYHYAKFTPLADGRIQMELCDANGLTNGGDPDWDNKTGFATHTMPMRLYFLDVKIRNNNGVITDAQGGGNYIKAMRRKDFTPNSFFAWIFTRVNPNGQESKNAEVIRTTLGENSDYDILMNPHLPINVRFQITIN